jgi:hypothetical protein
MPRQRDASIPAEESLFRGLCAEEIDGDAILDDAVDLRGTSCDRERYRVAVELLSEKRPHVAWVAAGDLPLEVKPPGQDAVPWDFFAADDPIEGNDAHCEIRVRRVTHRHLEVNDDTVRKRSAAAKSVLKHALASRFRLVVFATPEEDKAP